MKYIYESLMQFINQIQKDINLFVAIFIPIIIGIFFRFIIPLFEIDNIFYIIFDTILLSINPFVIGIIISIIIIREKNIYKVYDIRKNIMSIIYIPPSIAIIDGAIISFVFSLTNISFFESLFYSSLFGIVGIILCMIIILLSNIKMFILVPSVLFILFSGIILPFFINTNIRYLVLFIPTSLISNFILDNMFVNLIYFLLISCLYIVVLHNILKNKLDNINKKRYI